MSKLYSSLLSIALAFVFVSIILQLAGLYPFEFVASLVETVTGYDMIDGDFRVRYIGTFVTNLVPIMLTGISVMFAFKTGLFNIGAEGQFMVGSATAVFLGLNLDLPPVILPIVILVCSAIAGGLFGMIPGILKAWKNVHEVVICIMLNYVALYGMNLYYASTGEVGLSKTERISENAFLDSEFLKSLTDGSDMNWGILVAIICLVIYWFLVNKSTLGYKLKVIGFNKDSAHYAGINVKSGIVQSMAISGAFAGLAGAVLILGYTKHGIINSSFENYGFDGLNVALVSGGTSLGIVLSAILFAALKGAQPIMKTYYIPVEISSLVSGIIIYFISLSLITEDKLETFHRKRRLKKESKVAKEVKEEGEE